MEKAIRVLVANHPRLMRESVLTTFADQPDIEIVGEVADAFDLRAGQQVEFFIVEPGDVGQ